jgi:hypothetical protein
VLGYRRNLSLFRLKFAPGKIATLYLAFRMFGLFWSGRLQCAWRMRNLRNQTAAFESALSQQLSSAQAEATANYPPFQRWVIFSGP